MRATKAPQITKPLIERQQSVFLHNFGQTWNRKNDSKKRRDNNGVFMMEHKEKTSRGISDAVRCETTGYKFVIHFWANVSVVQGKEQLWQATEEIRGSGMLAPQEDFVFVSTQRGLGCSESVLLNWWKKNVSWVWFTLFVCLFSKRREPGKYNLQSITNLPTMTCILI